MQRLPLHPMQLGMFFHEQRSRGHRDGGFNIEQVVISLPELPPHSKVKQAIETIVANHAALQLGFHLPDGDQTQPYAKPASNFQISLNTLKISSTKSSAFETFLNNDRAQGFELDKPPLMRCAVVHIEESGESKIVWTMHHILLDGRSISSITQELLCHLFPQLETEQKDTQSVSSESTKTEDYYSYLKRIVDRDHHDSLAYFSRLYSQAGQHTRIASGQKSFDSSVSKPAPRIRGSFSNVADLHALANNTHTTLGTVVQAAWALTLSAHSNNRSIAFGGVRAGRYGDGIHHADTVGLFINTLPVFSQIDTGHTIVALLQALREQSLSAREHELTPLYEIQRHLATDQAVQPLEALLMFEKATLEELVLGGFHERPPGVHIELFEKADFPLTLTACAGQQLSYTLLYDPEKFPEGKIHSILDSFSHLLEQLAAHAKQPKQVPVKDLQLLSPSEYRRIVSDWNSLKHPFSDTALIHQLFEQSCERAPHVVALEVGSKEIRYAELEQKANQLANLLISLGCQVDDYIAVCLPRDETLIYALFAALKAGAAYVPIDPDFPSERIEHILTVTNARLILTAEKYANKFNSASKTLLIDGAHEKAWQNAVSTRPPLNRSSAKPCYTIFTSGSTGQPKGVVLAHRAVVNTLEWVNREFSVGAKDRLLFVTSPCFDLSVYDIFGALGAGATLVIADEADLASPEVLADKITQKKITIWNSAPAALQRLTPFLSHTSKTHLRLCLLSGDWIPLKLPDTLRASHPKTQVISLGGATEAAIWSNWYVINKVEPAWTSIPYGKPIANAQYYVLNEDLQALPWGVPGDLYIGGACLAEGYQGQPDLTQERFIHSPYLEKSAGVIYKTGDLSRHLADGNLEFLGRSDFQVKIRGYRVEMGEVEAVISQSNDIASCVCATYKDASDQNILIAYLIANEGRSVELQVIKQQCKSALPAYMVPSHFMILDELPVTVNGKLDRQALPLPNQETRKRKIVLPDTETEETLVDIWRTLFKREDISVDDNFFELGGHSLLVISLLSLVKQQGFQLNIGSVFDTASLRELAAHIDQHPCVDAGVDEKTLQSCKLEFDERQWQIIATEIGCQRKDIAYALPLTPIQHGLLYHHIISPVEDPYLLKSVLFSNSDERTNQFLARFEKITAMHDALRTRIIWKAVDTPIQIILCSAKVSVTHLGDTARLSKQQATEKILKGLSKSFDLAREPLSKLYIASCKEGDVIVWQFHHAILDHVSLEVISEQLAVGDSTLDNTKASYDSLIASIHATDTFEGNRYFAHLLDGFQTPSLPYNVSPEAFSSDDVKELTYRLSEAQSTSLRCLCKRLNCSPAAFFHAAWALVVAACSNTDEVVFGSVLLGRFNLPEHVQKTIGATINTLPLIVDLNSLSCVAFLHNIQLQLNNLLKYENVPINNVISESILPANTPLFSAMINYRHSTAASVADASYAFGGLPCLKAIEYTNFPLALFVDDYGDQHTFELTLQAYKPIPAEDVLEYTLTAISQLCLYGHQDTPVISLEVLPDEVQRKLLTWNHETQKPADHRCLHLWFEETAERQADNLAIIDEKGEWTYAQLNEVANRIAASIVDHNSKEAVGLLLNRSAGMVASMLGILKAGRCYVPLDPSYPVARLQLIAQDAELETLICESTTVGLANELAVNFLLFDAVVSEAQPNTVVPLFANNPDALAYIIYTSGSTGHPKGVEITHANASSLINWARATYTKEELAYVLASTSVCFDLSIFEIFVPLCLGTTVLMVENILSLNRYPLRQPPTLINTVPSGLEAVIALEALPTKTLVVNSAGELLKQSTVDALYQGGVAKVFDLYGPSEDTTYSTYTLRALGGHQTIGRPISNTKALVLDHHLKLCPPGVEGELYLSGHGLALGYRNQKELTAERFLPNPFYDPNSEDPHYARMYKTGDVVKWNAYGELVYLGRSDFQVKVRGFRVELNDIEIQLLKCEAVEKAVCVAYESGGVQALAAYLVPRDSESIDLSKLQLTLASHLPGHMVPSEYRILEEIPLTNNGKVDRKRLPDVRAKKNERSATTDNFDSNQALLYELWKELLQRNQISLDDNFFDVGGNSLLAVNLAARINKDLNGSLALAAILSNPTIRAQAVLVQSSQEQSDLLQGFNASGTLPPLILVPGKIGTAYTYRWLPERLGKDQPIYVANLISERLNAKQIQTIQDMARILVPDIIDAAKGKKVILGGYSFGALIAYEIAVQLQHEGIGTLFLISFDGLSPAYPKKLPQPEYTINLFRHFFRATPKDKLKYFHSAYQKSVILIRRLLSRNRLHHPPVDTIENLEEQLDVIGEKQLRARNVYLPEKRIEHTPMLLIRTAESARFIGMESLDSLHGWDQYITETITLKKLDCLHLEMWDEENAKEIAETILRYQKNQHQL